MSKKETFEDVNRQDYISSFFTELVGQKAMTSLDAVAKRAKTIADFVLGNAMNDIPMGGKVSLKKATRTAADDVESFDSRSRAKTHDGAFLIVGSKSLSNSFRKKAKKIMKNYELTN